MGQSSSCFTLLHRGDSEACLAGSFFRFFTSFPLLMVFARVVLVHMPEMPINNKGQSAEPPLIASLPITGSGAASPATAPAPTPQQEDDRILMVLFDTLLCRASHHQPPPAQLHRTLSLALARVENVSRSRDPGVQCDRMQSSCLPETILIIKKLRPGDKILNHRVAAVAVVAEVVMTVLHCTALLGC